MRCDIQTEIYECHRVVKLCLELCIVYTLLWIWNNSMSNITETRNRYGKTKRQQHDQPLTNIGETQLNCVVAMLSHAFRSECQAWAATDFALHFFAHSFRLLNCIKLKVYIFYLRLSVIGKGHLIFSSNRFSRMRLLMLFSDINNAIVRYESDFPNWFAYRAT